MTIEEVLQHDLNSGICYWVVCKPTVNIILALETKVLIVCGLVLKRHKLSI